MTTFLNTITLEGVVNISRNCTTNGGGILASACKVDLFGNISFFKNAASDTGGAIYLQQSEVNIKGSAFLKENSANSKGGAIHAVRSYVSLTLIRKLPFSSSHLYLISNCANKGGGIYFEVYSKLYIMSMTEVVVQFIGNVADFGSAMLVNDSTNTVTCASNDDISAMEASETKCFFQQVSVDSRVTIMHKVFNFTNNIARQAGMYLYGGLLDRCTVNTFGTTDVKYIEQPGAFDYIRNFTASNPLRICFCNSYSLADCSYRPSRVRVKLGYNFPCH